MNIIQTIADQAIMWSVAFAALCVLVCLMHMMGED